MGNTGSQPNRPLTEEGSVNLAQWDEEYQGPLVEQDEEPQQPSSSSRLVSQPSSSRKSWPTQDDSDYTRVNSSGPDPSSPMAFDLDPWEELEYQETPDRSLRRRFRAELRAQREPSYETYVRNARARIAAGRGVSASPPASARRSASASSRSRTPLPTSPDYALDEEHDLAQGTNPPRPARTSPPRRAATPDLPDYEDYEEDDLPPSNANPPPPAGTNAPRRSPTPDLPDYEDYEQEENANDPFRHSNRQLWQRQQDERFRRELAAREANSSSDSSSDRRPRAGNDSEDEMEENDNESEAEEEENNDPCAAIRRERDQLRDALALARADLRAEQARRMEEQFLLDQVAGGADAANAQVDRLRLENQRLRRALVRRGSESDYGSPSASSSSPSSRQRTQSQTPTPAGRAPPARELVAVEPSPPPRELLDMLPAATTRRMNTRSQVAEGGRTPPRGLWSPQRASRSGVGAGVSRGGGRGAVKKSAGKGRRGR